MPLPGVVICMGKLPRPSRFVAPFSGLLLALVFFGPSVATATTQPTVDLEGAATAQVVGDDDLTWEFAPRGVLADTRVLIALAILLDEAAVMDEAGLAGQPLFYGEPELRSVLEEVPEEDAAILLEAAGVAPQGEPAGLEQSRRCRIWTPPDSKLFAERAAVVEALSNQLVEVFAGIGVTIDRCEPATSAREADLAVSTVTLPGGLAPFGEGIGGPFITSIGDAASADGATGGALAPGQGGNAGLGGGARGTPDMQVIAATGALLLLLFSGRLLSSVRRGR